MPDAAHTVRGSTPATGVRKQFDIAEHYDMMAQLDRDVHDDLPLAATETELALTLIGDVPGRMFLPCCGTGRHIPPLRQHGVRRIVGVDLSPRCLAKAQELTWLDHGRALTLVQADLTSWRTAELFDAAMLLGNSFGDITDPTVQAQVTAGMMHPVRAGGVVIFDYIGESFLDRCREGRTSEWDAVLYGRLVKDRRTPRFDPTTHVMTIDVVVTAADDGLELWRGAYEKLILSDDELVRHFAVAGVTLERVGRATELNHTYYGTRIENLGMIAASTWWRGTKRG